MRAFLLLATATALMLNGSASAQQDRWTFDVLTIWHFVASGHSTVKREPYGVFTSRDDCDRARAKKIAELDDNNLRQPHLPADAPTISSTVQWAAQRLLRNKRAVRPKRCLSPLVTFSASRQTTKRSYRRMRYLSFLAAVLASAPAYAQYKDTVVLQPGFAEAWQAPRPFTQVIVGNPEMIDVIQGSTDRQLIITVKPLGTYQSGPRHYQYLATGCEGKPGRKRAGYQCISI